MIKELVIKELKNTLRDKRMLLSLIIIPLLMFIIMGGIMRFAMTATFKEALEKRTVYIVNNDLNKYSEVAINYIREKGFKVKVFENTDAKEVLSNVEEADVVIEFPEGFSYNLSKGFKARILTYVSVKGLSIGVYAVLGKVSGLISEISAYLSKVLIKEVVGNVNPEFILNPIASEPHMFIGGKEVSATFMSILGFFSAGVIVAPLVLVATTIGVSSSMIAVENEERTLEVLLTLPISRFKILLGKLVGVIILVLIATLSFIVGFTFYITAPMAAFEELHGVGGSLLKPSPMLALFDIQTVALTAVAVFFTLIAVGALGLLLGSIAPDVRTAQTYIAPLSFIVFIPGMMLMFLDLSKFTMLAQIVLIVISPFISPILVFKSLFEGIPWIAYASLTWTIAFTFMMVAIAAKFMETEKILTLQFTLKMRGLRKKAK